MSLPASVMKVRRGLFVMPLEKKFSDWIYVLPCVHFIFNDQMPHAFSPCFLKTSAKIIS